MMSRRFGLINVKLLFGVLIAMWLIAAGQRAEVVTLGYFRVVDKATYAKAPAKYERVIYREPTGELEVYVERQPAHEIPANGIESVIVRKEKKYGSSPEELEDFRRAVKESLESKPRGKKKVPEMYPSGFFYSITFKLKSSEWKREVTFTNKNLEQTFQMRLGQRDLGLTQFLLPIEEGLEENEFTLYTQESDANRIKEMLSPIKDRVSWE